MRRVQPAMAAVPLALIALLTFSPVPASTHPYPLQNTNNENQDAALRYLMPRNCVQRCGSDGQYCCAAGQECFTSENIAGCTAHVGGAFGIFTTTWTETNTFTSTVTTQWAQPTHEPADPNEECVPQNEGEVACGHICCADFQYCAAKGSCEPRENWGGGGGAGAGGGDKTTTEDQKITTRYSAPYRPTGSTFTGSQASSTETAPTSTGTAVGSDGDGGEAEEGTGGGLSPGAIAGIVVGVLAGLALLGLICFCCIVRGLWALCCGGKKKNKRHDRERVEVVEERYRSGSRMPPTAAAAGHTHRERHGGWFGRPSSAGARRNEKDGGGGKWLGLGAGAATLLALLNLRKDKKPERKPRSRYTDSYYSYTDSPNSSSAGARTHHTRRSERAESRYSRR